MKFALSIACLALGLAVFKAASVVAQQPSPAPSSPPTASADSLAKELERCRLLNEKAIGDARCDAAYRENQRLFFRPPAPYQPQKVEMFHDTAPSTVPAKPTPPAADK
jgi:conjugative transfer region protein TrbK